MNFLPDVIQKIPIVLNELDRSGNRDFFKAKIVSFWTCQHHHKISISLSPSSRDKVLNNTRSQSGPETRNLASSSSSHMLFCKASRRSRACGQRTTAWKPSPLFRRYRKDYAEPSYDASNWHWHMKDRASTFCQKHWAKHPGRLHSTEIKPGNNSSKSNRSESHRTTAAPCLRLSC